MFFYKKGIVPVWINKKHLLLVTLISLSILLNIALFSDRLRSSAEASITDQVPFIFWPTIVICTGLCLLTAYIWKDWRISLLMAVAYFFIFYSYNLFFRLIPTQSDVSTSAFFMWYLDNQEYLDVNVNYYFEYPIFFVFSSLLKESLGLGLESTINVGFFIVILIYPISLVTVIQKDIFKNNYFQLFTFPVMYLLLIFFFFNDQFAPQFIGLFFLISTVGMYIQLIETKDVRFFYLTIFLYIVCIFSHPFMFVFFILGVLYHKIYNWFTSGFKVRINIDIGSESRSIMQLITKTLSERNRLLSIGKEKVKKFNNAVLSKYSGKGEKKDVSLIVLIVIFYIAYKWRFSYIATEIRRALSPDFGEGGSWVIIARLRGDRTIRGTDFIPEPLFNLVPESEYLMIRYLVFGILALLFVLMIYTIIRIDRKRLLPFDLAFVFGSVIFMFAGFFSPNLLGERSYQTFFLTPTKYISQVKRRLFVILVLIITISPLVFTLSVTINHTLDGNMFIHDDSTFDTGIFVQDYRPENITILCADRLFYPIDLAEFYEDPGYNTYIPLTLLNTTAYDIEDVDLIIMSPKMENRMKFYRLQDELDIIDNCSRIYDQGEGAAYVLR